LHIKNIARPGLISILLTLLAALAAPVFAMENNGKSNHLPNMLKSTNEHGIDATYSTAGSIDLNNPFFQSLGNNDRSCATCHVPSEGWVITPKGVQERFNETDGLDPLFRLVDGANSPIEDGSNGR